MSNFIFGFDSYKTLKFTQEPRSSLLFSLLLNKEIFDKWKAGEIVYTDSLGKVNAVENVLLAIVFDGLTVYLSKAENILSTRKGKKGVKPTTPTIRDFYDYIQRIGTCRLRVETKGNNVLIRVGKSKEENSNKKWTWA